MGFGIHISGRDSIRVYGLYISSIDFYLLVALNLQTQLSYVTTCSSHHKNTSQLCLPTSAASTQPSSPAAPAASVVD